jgi:ATP-dependent RNA helicase DeaD
MAGESGVTRDRIGRIELRDSHTLVDVATEVVDQVVTAMNGAMMRGRRLVARVDQGRAEGGERGGRPERGERSDRGPRGGGGGERGGRPGGRPPFRSTGDERRASFGRTLNDEQKEWTQRGERIRHSRRTRDDDRA